ncbi:substrate-binding domain-containing protein [Actinoallomurus acaciae]|uniref:Substrate-binding domain-containing protein n=1 Tax=Actinoallomurus acaciae TaxID=502577 RepID=A0ABV5YIQ8_9ACTN
MARIRRPVAAVVALGVAAALSLSACSSGKESTDTSAGKKVSGKISLAYLQKQGDQQYFIDEAQGAKDKAKQLGNVDIKVVNLGNDTNKAVSETQAAVAQKVNGVIIVPPDPAVGPQIVQTAAAAKVTLLTSDDQVCKNGPDPSKCAKDQLVQRVGFSGSQMGQQVGQRAAEEFKKAGWKASDTAVISAWKQDVTVCTDRVVAAQAAFEQAAGKVQVIKVGTDNTPTDAQSKTGAVVSGHRSVKHWVVWGCNDENVSGAVTALQNAGYKAADIDGVGLGAYLACKDWNSGKATGMKAALFINGYDVGGLAVQTIVDNLRNGKPMPQEAFAPTKMVDASNWKQEGVKCT